MTEQTDYPTDKFGKPNGRDYHYRIPLNNDAAMRLAAWALNGMVRYQDRFVTEWKEYSGDSLCYMGIQTHDSKGHLKGLAEYAHSPQWKDLGVMSDIDEYRHGNGGGTKIRGTFSVDPQSFNGVSTLQFDTVIDQTPSELEQAYENMGDVWTNIQEQVSWAKQKAMDNAHEQIANKQRSCNHEHAVFPEKFVGEMMDSDGYCEDCGAEITEDKELAY